MASTYSPKLRFELIGSGEQAGLWGTTTNKNIGQLIEQAIAGVSTVELDGVAGNYTLTTLDGTPDQARSAVIKCTYSAVPAAGPINLIIPTQTKLYVVRNDCGATITVKTSAQTGGVQILNGESTLVFCDGSIAEAGIETAAVGTLTVSGGGTGQTSFTAGFLKSTGGTAALTTASAVNLATEVTNTLPVGNGGTGTTAFTAGRLLVGNGSGTIATLAGSVDGQLATWNSSLGTWVAQSPPSGAVTSVTGSGSGISISPTSGAVVVQNTGVTSFNSRTGAVSLGGADVTNALGYTPYNSSNPSGYITSSALTNYVTTNTTQTISGDKTFSGTVSLSGYVTTGTSQTITGNKTFNGTVGVNNTMTINTGVGGGIVSTAYNFTTTSNSIFWTGTEAHILTGGVMRFFCGSSSGGFSFSDVQKVGGGTFNSYSDRRYKQDITNYNKGLADLKQLNPVNYRYTAEFMHSTQPSKPFVGLIAQDVQQTAFADSVTLDSKGYCILDTNQLTYALINAVQELSSQVDALKAEVAALKGA